MISRLRRKQERETPSAQERFFCGQPKGDDPDTFFMGVFTQDGRAGVWPCHEQCVLSNKHPDAGDLQGPD